MIEKCWVCGTKREDRNPYPSFQEMQELYSQTPVEVWREYFDNGYNWAQAIRQEFSYA